MTENSRKKFWPLLILTLWFSQVQYAQNCFHFQTDIQGNEYTFTDQELTKKSIQGNNTFQYSNKLLGNLYEIDVNNPLRPILFYKDVQKIVITDNTLSAQNEEVISLEELGMYQVTCIASSKMDNGIWVYDQELFQVVKLDQTLNKTIETGNLKQLLKLPHLEPIDMMEKNGYLYVECREAGILIFDIYGTYYKTILIQGLNTWNIIGDYFVYAKDGLVHGENLNLFESIAIQLEDQEGDIIWIDNKFIYYCLNSKVIKQAMPQ